MGIKGLHKILKKECNDIYETISISEYSYKKIAIDISLYLYKFKTIAGNRWLMSFLNLICCLRRNNIHCIFIYDTKSLPDKEQEKKERYDQKQKSIDRMLDLEEALDDYHKNGVTRKCLIDLYNKRNNLDKNNVNIDMNIVEGYVNKIKNYTVEIYPEDFDITKKLFDILKVPYYNSPNEGERLCVELMNKKLVDAVLTEDTDVLAYGVDTFLFDIDMGRGLCRRIRYDSLLEGMNMTREQFTDLCIMLGCDYNSNIPKVGPVNALKLIKQYNSIDNIKNQGYDTDILKYERMREIFSDVNETDIKEVKWCGVPDFVELEEFIAKNNVNTFNIDYLRKVFTQNDDILFEE